MTYIPYILAQNDDDAGWGKLVFAIIFVVFWIISAIASWVNKKTEEARRRQVRDQITMREQMEMERQGGTMPTPPPVPMRTVPPPIRQAPPPIRQVPQPMQRAPRVEPRPPKRSAPVPPTRPKTKKRPQPVVQRAPVIEPEMPAPTSGTSLAGTTSGIEDRTAAAANQAGSADAASIARWLNPQTLRSQFILTELLQKPLALRDDPADDLG